MVVTESTPLCATEALISKRKRRHYRTSVIPIHWQLRSLIGSGRDGIVYFATGTGNLHLQRLDTKTLETETIQLLSFSPRCLVAQNGWVCCGGETGEFVAVQVETQTPDSDGYSPDQSFPRSPFGLGRSDTSMTPFPPPSRIPAPMPRSKVYGKERVNCITLWFPSTSIESHESAYKSPVAVLANNDKHVTLVELPSMETLNTLQYPDCVNRALLSPDGQMLVAVGDDPYLYVHVRATPLDSSSTDDTSTGSPSCSWKQVRKVHLKSQTKHDKSDHRGSFAACFSHTGSYLAVGTQYGMISVFETSALLGRDTDALRAYFPSSRPAVDKTASQDPLSAVGAVREMAFSPGPYDILAWSEDRGRAGVADLRSGFATRQILYLDGDDKATEHLDVADRSAIDPRLLDCQPPRSGTLAGDLLRTLDISSSSGSTRPRAEDSYQHPLTGEETQVLEALQGHRRRREQRAAAARELMRHQWGSASTVTPQPPIRTVASEGFTGSRPAAAAEPRVTLRRPPTQTSESDRDRVNAERRDALADFYISEASNRIADYPRSTTTANNSSPRIQTLIREEERRSALAEERARQRATREAIQRFGSDGEAQRNRTEELIRQTREHVDAHRELVQRFLRDSEEEAPSSSSTTERYWRERYRASVGTADSNAEPGVDSGSTHIRVSTAQPDPAREPNWMAGLPIPIPSAGLRPTNSARTTTAPNTTASNTRISSWAELGALYGAMSNIGGSNPQGGGELPASSNDAPPEPRQQSTNAATNAALRDHEAAWFSLLRQVGMHTTRNTTRTLGDETAGLTWSSDGSTLYIGAVDGIYEFHVNIHSRKFNPSVQLR